ncbi:MAG: NAD(P)H-hydrate dehydratase [Clostridiales bacterium]|nr:NAD(P)H-hydrate dehydratase [Clostridiales bacterium]
MFLLTVDEMKALKRCAIDSYHIPGIILMEHAGYAVAETIMKNYKKTTPILVVCGRGNNGGDGFVVSRKLLLEGYSVKVIVIGNVSSIKGDALTNYKILKKINKAIFSLERYEDTGNALTLFSSTDVIVDAIFGTGLNSSVRTLEASVIDLINNSKAKVISIDMPSGINGSTAKVMKSAVKADLTIAFDAFKCGNVLYPGAEYNGELKVANIGIPKTCYEQIYFPKRILTEKVILSRLPIRKKNSHKGTFGKASIIAGSSGMEGAAILSCSAAMRTGLGLLKLFVPKSMNHIVKTSVPEMITVLLEESVVGSYDLSSIDIILDHIKNDSVVAIGPGCGQHKEIGKTVRRLLTESELPLVIDADGLNMLSLNMSWLIGCSKDIVLTPHVAEMSRLTKLSIAEILDDPIKIARKYAVQWEVTVVLKSARTIVATKDGNIYININGNSGMATAGTGDVLTGIITGLMAQGLSGEDASVLGVFVHGYSGDKAAEMIGEYGLLAGDIIKQIPYTLKALSHRQKG